MKTELVSYEHEGTILEGFLAYDDSIQEKRPGIILCHAWRGRDDFVCEKAQEISKWGYPCFALDLYGKGVLGSSKEENMALMMPLVSDRIFLQSRLDASLKVFQKHSCVDSNSIAVIGFCFGGLCALDFARSNIHLKGAISVHGLLDAPKDQKLQKIRAKVLVLHGHDDPMVPPDKVLAFEQEMTALGADWQVHIYGQTMHAFTNPIANDPDFGTVYNPLAAKRAWQSIQNFLVECFNF